MNNPLLHINPGDDWKPNATWIKYINEVIRAHLEKPADDNATPEQSDAISIYNDRAEPFEEFAIVGIGEPTIPPSDTSDVFKTSVVFNSTPPAHGSPFAVLQAPANMGSIAEAVITGETWVLVDVQNEAHGYAAPADGDYEQLTSQASPGPAKILWKEDGTGQVWAFVRLQAVSSGIITLTFGTDPAQNDLWVNATSGGTILEVPDASTTARGVITTGLQELTGDKVLVDSSFKVASAAVSPFPVYVQIATDLPSFTNTFGVCPGVKIANSATVGRGIATYQYGLGPALDFQWIATDNPLSYLWASGDPFTTVFNNGGFIYGAPTLQVVIEKADGSGTGITYPGAWFKLGDGFEVAAGLVIKPPGSSIGVYGGGPGPTITPSLTKRALSNPNPLVVNGSFFSTTAGNNVPTFTTLSAVGTCATSPTPTATTISIQFTGGSNAYPTTTGTLRMTLAVSSVTTGGSTDIAVALVVPDPTVTTTTTAISSTTPTITITGTGFDDSAPGANLVTFTTRGAAGVVIAATTTSLTVQFTTAPTSTGSLDAKVNSFGGDSNTTQVADVTTTSTHGPVVTYNGTSLISTTTTSIFVAGAYFDPVAANNSITFTPAGSGTVSFSASTGGVLTVTGITGLTAGPLYAVVTTNGLTSGAPVQVATVSPPPTVTENLTRKLSSYPGLDFGIVKTFQFFGTGFATGSSSVVTLNSTPLTTSSTPLAASGSGTTSITVTSDGTQMSAGPLMASVAVSGGPSSNTAQVADVVDVTITPATTAITTSTPTLRIDGANFDPVGITRVRFSVSAGSTPQEVIATYVDPSGSFLIATFNTYADAPCDLFAQISCHEGYSGDTPVKVAVVGGVGPTVTPSTTVIAPDAATMTVSGTGFSATAIDNTIALSSGTAHVTASTTTSLTISFDTPPSDGALLGVVTVSGVDSGAPAQIAKMATTAVGSGAITMGPMTIAGVGTFVAVATGGGAIMMGPMEVAGSGTFTAPVFTGDGAITMGAMTVAGTGTFTAPVFTGSGAIAMGPMEVAGTGTFTSGDDGPWTFSATDDWVVPADADYEIIALAPGGLGGAAYTLDPFNGGGGGGGGAVAIATVALTTGDTLTVSVPSSGDEANCFVTSLADGLLVSAAFGHNGLSADDTTPGAGGQGGQIGDCTGDTSYAGGDGADGVTGMTDDPSNNGGGGGSASDSAGGSNASGTSGGTAPSGTYVNGTPGSDGQAAAGGGGGPASGYVYIRKIP